MGGKRLAGLDENREVASLGLIAVRNRINVRLIDRDAAAKGPVFSAAMSVEPEPRNGSMTISPRWVRRLDRRRGVRAFASGTISPLGKLRPPPRLWTSRSAIEDAVGRTSPQLLA
jgi:hypothetical protein